MKLLLEKNPLHPGDSRDGDEVFYFKASYHGKESSMMSIWRWSHILNAFFIRYYERLGQDHGSDKDEQ